MCRFLVSLSFHNFWIGINVFHLLYTHFVCLLHNMGYLCTIICVWVWIILDKMYAAIDDVNNIRAFCSICFSSHFQFNAMQWHWCDVVAYCFLSLDLLSLSTRCIESKQNENPFVYLARLDIIQLNRERLSANSYGSAWSWCMHLTNVVVLALQICLICVRFHVIRFPWNATDLHRQ